MNQRVLLRSMMKFTSEKQNKMVEYYAFFGVNMTEGRFYMTFSSSEYNFDKQFISNVYERLLNEPDSKGLCVDMSKQIYTDKMSTIHFIEQAMNIINGRFTTAIRNLEIHDDYKENEAISKEIRKRFTEDISFVRLNNVDDNGKETFECTLPTDRYMCNRSIYETLRVYGYISQSFMGKDLQVFWCDGTNESGFDLRVHRGKYEVSRSDTKALLFTFKTE